MRTSSVLSQAGHLRQPVASYFQSNIHITTSGYFTPQPFRCALDVVGLNRLLFSVDYPFSPNTRGRTFLNNLADMLSVEDPAKLARGNAESVLRLQRS